MAHKYNVLFVCSGNSARSIMAEAILNRDGAGEFVAYSAGSRPKGEVNAHALDLLKVLGYDTTGLRSKSWDEFAGEGGPAFDFVFTLCDEAAGEACPVLPGNALTTHWGIPDPAATRGTPAVVAAAFEDTYRMLERRIGELVALPIRTLDRLSLHARLHEIGRASAAA